MKVTMTYQRESKNQYVFGGPLGSVMYVPKVWFPGTAPRELVVELPSLEKA